MTETTNERSVLVIWLPQVGICKGTENLSGGKRFCRGKKKICKGHREFVGGKRVSRGKKKICKEHRDFVGGKRNCREWREREFVRRKDVSGD